MFKYLHHRIQRTVLASALIAAAPLTNTINLAQAGIMVDTYDPILYGDMANGKGVFAPGKTNIQIYDINGNLRGAIPYSVDPQGIADELFLTLVNPSFGISANHVGYTTDVTFGNAKTFVFNDGTLFDGSGTSKPFNGNSAVDDTNEWNRLLVNKTTRKQWRDIFTKYLSSNYHEANPDRMIWYKNNYATDFKLDRYMKINVDAIPYEIMTNDDKMKVGDKLLHIGAGTAQIHSRADSANKVYLTYSTPIGGLGTVSYVGNADVYQKQANPNNTTEDPNKILVGNAFKWVFNTTQKDTDVLEQGILGGDSGSPIFWLDPNTNTWKLAGATSSITGYTFGAQTNFIGNMPWVAERIKFYDNPDINLKDNDILIFHGQNSMNGVGNIHILTQGATDTNDQYLKDDTERVSKLVDKDIENQKYIIDEKTAKRTPATVKPGLTLGTEEEYKNSLYTNTSEITYIEYKGYAYGYDFSRFGSTSNKYVNDQIIYKNHDLNKVTKNLIINGAGQGKQTLITFSEDVTVNNNTINLGADSITLNSGDFIIKQNPNIADPTKQIKSFINAGYIINTDASLRYELDGQANDAIHKLGQGTLTIAGKGNQLSPLNVGQGLTLLDRENGTATPYLKIASGRAIVRLMRDGQLTHNLDGKTNNIAVGFGQKGGILDFNGFNKNQTWIDIYHLDQGATIANLKSGQENRVTFTFNPNGKRSYLGSFIGNLDLVYQPSDTSSADKATWMLKNTVDITGDVKLTNQANLVLGDVRTARGWGQYYNDRYDRVIYMTNTTTMEDGSSLKIGRNTLFSSDVTARDNTRIEIHNRDKLIAADDKYPIENQYLVEKTVLDGSLTLTDTTQVIVDVDAGHVIDIFSDVHGSGSLTLTGKGVINIGGNNTFKGKVKVCETNNTSNDCQTALNFVTKLGEEITFDSLETPTLPEDFINSQLSQEQAGASVSSTTPVYADTTTRLASDELTLNQSITLTTATSSATTTNSATMSRSSATTTKPIVEQLEFDSHTQWTNNEITVADQAEQQYTHNTQTQEFAYIPVPEADSLIVNFFSKEALFQQATMVDTTNAKVVLYTNFADATQNEAVQWDLGNYTGDAFIIKDGAYSLQIKNHNLTGTLFIREGSIVTDSISSHLVIGRNAILYADARNSLHNATLHGRVFNAGTIYLTQKDKLLPATTVESQQPTVTPPSITIPSSSSTTIATSNDNITATNSVTLAQGANITSAVNTAVISNTIDDGMLVTGDSVDARRNLTTLEINSDYYGDNGKIIYDMNHDATQVHIKGNASGKTTLVIQDISAVTAAGRESFDIMTVDGNIEENAFVLQNGYVSGGIYDYITKAAGKDIKLISYIDEANVEIVPSWSLGTETPPSSENLPVLDPFQVQISTSGEPLLFPELPYFDVNSVAGSRIINSSVGTLLANRRFISNLNVTPMSLGQRPGLFMSVDRDSESLEFTGADYSSTYNATRTLLGNNFTILPNLKVGIFANAATAASVIDNKVNSATGKVNAMGIGGFAQTQVNHWLELYGATQYLYAKSAVEGTHNQAQVLHGGFAALQVALSGLNYSNFLTIKPYLLVQAEFTPTSHFLSRLGEELGTITANTWTNALGIQASVNYARFGLEVDAYQTFGQRVTEFNSYYSQDHIAAYNNSYRVQTTASYQLLPNLKVSSYLNMHGNQRTTGIALDVQW